MKNPHTLSFQQLSAISETSFHREGAAASQLIFLWQPSWDGAAPFKKNLLRLFLGRWFGPSPERNSGAGNKDQRTVPRFNIPRKILIFPLRPQISHRPFWADIHNLSKKGVCVETHEPLSATQLILLDFESAGKRKLRTPARVVWTKDKVTGLEFLDSSGVEEFLRDTIKP